jgi:tRNA A-37 threonylcarbamoyl transferase component Bud32
VDYLANRGHLDAAGVQRLNEACAAESARFRAESAPVATPQAATKKKRGVTSSLDSGVFQALNTADVHADPGTASWGSGARRVTSPPPAPPAAPHSGGSAAHVMPTPSARGSGAHRRQDEWGSGAQPPPRQGSNRWGSGALTTGPVPTPPAPVNTEVSTIIDENGNPITGTQRLPSAQVPTAPAAATAAAAAAHSLDSTLQYDRVVPTPLAMSAPIPPASARSDPKLETTGDAGRAVIPVDSGEDANIPGLVVAAPESPVFEIDVDTAAAEEPLLDPNLPVAMPDAGEIMGNYKLMSLLGKGATGTVYKAVHTSTQEIVALKVMNVVTGVIGQKRRQRFKREVDALRRLQHENIVGIHNFGRKGAHDFLVMDVVEGRELKEILIEGNLKPLEKLQIFETICKAVTHAHERGVVHRDLKPANVVIGAGNSVHVLDFGLAKLINEADTDEGKLDLTQTHAALGTPYYMAPEQLFDPKGVDWRADCYSLGVMLFELMVGHRPFDGQTAGELIKKVLEDPPPLPSKLSDRLQPRFDQICHKALEKDREDRYQNVDDLRLAVAGYRRGTFLRQATSPSAQSEKAKRWLGKNKVPFAIGAVVASLFWIPVLCFVYLFL